MKKLQKVFAWISILSLILQVSSGLVFARPAFAEEEVIDETPIEEVVEEEPVEEPTGEEPLEETPGEPVVEEPTGEEPSEEPVIEEPPEEPAAEDPPEEPLVEETVEEPAVEEVNPEPVEEEISEEPAPELEEPIVAEESAKIKHTTLQVIRLEGEDAIGGIPQNTWTPGNVVEYREGDTVRFRTELIIDPSESGTFDTLFTHEDHSSSLGTCTFFVDELVGYELTGPSFSGSAPTGLTVTPSAVTIVGPAGSNEGKITWTVSTDGTVIPDAGAGLIFTLRLSDVAGVCDGSSQHVHNENNTGDVDLQQTQNVNVPANKLIVLGSITVYKYLADTQVLLPGATFTLCPSGVTPPDVSCTEITDGVSPDPTADGIVVFDGLETSPQGIDYDVFETLAPSGYTPDPNSPKTVTLTRDNPDQTVDFYNFLATGNLIVHKVYTDQAGIEVTINVTDALGPVESQMTVGGSANFPLEPGTYSASADEPASYHEQSNTCVDVAVTSGQTSECWITNTPDTGSLTLLKSEENQINPGDWNFDVSGDSGYSNLGVPSGTTLDFLPLGTYTVNENGPANYHFESGSGEGCSFDSGGTLTVVVDQDGDTFTCTFINAPDLGSISGVKFNDLDGDGDPREGGEPGLPGWTINLIDAAGAIVDSTTTAADGSYSFSDLDPGEYGVCEVPQPPDWTRTYPGDDCYYGVFVGPGGVITDKDFGNFMNVDITVCKYIDSNGDGIGDTPFTGGWRMTLNPGDISQTTGGDGCTTFLDLAPGSYSVTEETRPDWTPTGPTTHDFGQVESGNQSYSWTFGNFENVSVTACKLIDTDGDLNTTGDQGVKSSWPVYLSIDGVRQIPGEQTGDNGCYAWTNLGPGHSYDVEEDVPSGWTALTPTSFDFGPAQSGEESYSYTFINFKNIKISGYKFNDLNGDGNWDPGELPIQGWLIQYWGSSNGGATTDSNGYYELPNPVMGLDGFPPGIYYVGEPNMPAGWIQTLPNDPSNYNPSDGYYYKFEWPTGDQENVNFGNTELGSISGHKWEDKNLNQVFDGSDQYLENWTIKLWQGTYQTPPVTPPDDTTLTDVNGYYSFENLIPGDYVVCEEVKPGWVQYIPGSNDCYYYTVQSGSQITGADFLNYQKGKIQGRKYEDLNANGVHDNATEDRLNGWTVRLYDDGWNQLDEVTTSNTGNIGQYRFEGLELGTYYVCEVLKDDWIQTGPLEAAPSVDNSYNPTGDGLGVFNGSGESDEGGVCWRTEINESGQLRGWLKFGNFELGKIRVCKYEDLDGEKGDPIPGVTMVLKKWVCGLDGLLDVFSFSLFNGICNWVEIDSGETEEDGCYEFDGLSHGDYRVSEIVPPFYLQTYPTNPNYHQVLVGSGTNTEVYFLNTPLEPEISIAKENDKSGGASAGDTVNYTLTLTNGPVPLNVNVTDVMPDGFDYVVGSGEVDGVPTEPTVSGNILTWNDVYLMADDTVEITYQAVIDGSQPTGTYYNLATCDGSTGEFVREPLTAECDVVDSSVPVGEGISTTTSIGGVVLGIATEAVLGAATGSETYWLIMAFLMILAGVSIMFMTKERRGWLLKKMAGISKKLSVFAAVILALFIFAGVVQAAVVVKVADLPGYKRTDNFKLYYTVLDTSNPSSVNAMAYVKKDGGFGWKTFGGTQTDPSGSFEAFGYDLDGDGTYHFYVQANGVNSSETSTTVDREGPEAPKDYRKSREGSTAFRIFWKNPSNSDYSFTRIFASTERDFTADDATKKADVGGSPDQEQNHLVTGLEPNKEYYFALQGFDKAGNPSGLAGDGGSVTYEEVAGEAVAGEGVGGEEVVVLPMEEAGEGEILGEEEVPEEEAQAEEEVTGLIGGAATQIAGTNKGLLAVGAGILLALAGLGYYFYRKRTS